tara:strand:- start:158 stop:307 length:150 start_codon:yes stop_codon:yes gene_type:complete
MNSDEALDHWTQVALDAIWKELVLESQMVNTTGKFIDSNTASTNYHFVE